MWTAVILSCLSLLTTSIAASIAAQGEDSSLSDLTFMPPVTLANVYLPVKSVTWMKVSFHVARMWQTAKKSPWMLVGPKLATAFQACCSSVAAFSSFFFPLPACFSAGLSTGFSAAAGVGAFATSAIGQYQLNIYIKSNVLKQFLAMDYFNKKASITSIFILQKFNTGAIYLFQLFSYFHSDPTLINLIIYQRSPSDPTAAMFDEPLSDNGTPETITEQHNLNPNQLAPNNTLYISNLNQKLPLDDLKDELFTMLEEYGEILDIVAKKNIRMRGQAFVIFKDINSAMEARRAVNGREFYGKTMKVNFAKEKSDAIAKLDGTFHIRERPDNYFQTKFEQKFVLRPQQAKNRAEREKNVGRKIDKSHNLPNHILFCQGLTPEITAEKLTALFIRYPGLVDVRLAPKNFAFIEFTDQFKSGTALAALNGIEFEGCTLQITYAKK